MLRPPKNKGNIVPKNTKQGLSELAAMLERQKADAKLKEEINKLNGKV